MLAEIAPEILPKTNARLITRALPILRCTECGSSQFLPYQDESFSPEFLTHSVIVCQGCHTCYPYDGGILDLMKEIPEHLTLAQRTNFWFPIADHYQEYWRSWCMTLFCGKRFSNDMEAGVLNHSMRLNDLVSDSACVDIGTSHGFYAIRIAQKLREHHSDGYVIAIDFSRKMLQQAVHAAEKAGVTEWILFILADVENTPLIDGCVDRVSCGGSLNEYRNPENAISQAFRILKPDGSFFAMNLFKKSGLLSMILPIVQFISGLKFFSLSRWNQLFSEKKFHVREQSHFGSAMFTTLTK